MSADYGLKWYVWTERKPDGTTLIQIEERAAPPEEFVGVVSRFDDRATAMQAYYQWLAAARSIRAGEAPFPELAPEDIGLGGAQALRLQAWRPFWLLERLQPRRPPEQE